MFVFIVLCLVCCYVVDCEGTADSIRPLFVVVVAAAEHIGEEKQLQDRKHDKQFDYDQQPQTTSDSHSAESLDIETYD